MTALSTTTGPSLLQILVEGLGQIQRETKAMLGLFTLQIGNHNISMPIEGYEWQEVEDSGGVFMCALSVDQWPENPIPDADYFLTKGPGGITNDYLVIKQGVVNKVLTGGLEFWKQSEPQYRYYGPQDVFTLEANEPHGWRSKEDFTCLIAFSPRILR